MNADTTTKIFLVIVNDSSPLRARMKAYTNPVTALAIACEEAATLLRNADLPPGTIATDGDLKRANEELLSNLGSPSTRVSIAEVDLDEPNPETNKLRDRHYQCFVDNTYCGPKHPLFQGAEAWAQEHWGSGQEMEWTEEPRLDRHENPSWVSEIAGRQIYIVERLGAVV